MTQFSWASKIRGRCRLPAGRRRGRTSAAEKCFPAEPAKNFTFIGFLSTAGMRWKGSQAFLCGADAPQSFFVFSVFGGQALNLPGQFLKGHAPGGLDQDHRAGLDQVGQQGLGPLAVLGIQGVGHPALAGRVVDVPG